MVFFFGFSPGLQTKCPVETVGEKVAVFIS